MPDFGYAFVRFVQCVYLQRIEKVFFIEGRKNTSGIA